MTQPHVSVLNRACFFECPAFCSVLHFLFRHRIARFLSMHSFFCQCTPFSVNALLFSGKHLTIDPIYDKIFVFGERSKWSGDSRNQAQEGRFGIGMSFNCVFGSTGALNPTRFTPNKHNN